MLSCVVIDTETTGIRAAENRVIEIGAVRIEEDEIRGRFETLVDPGILVPWRITRLTGITTRDLAGAPGPEEAWARFLEFAGDLPFVAHHAPFDRGFLEAELGRLDLAIPVRDWLCTVRLSRRVVPGLSSYSLGSVARFLGVPLGTRHRALADAEVTAAVLLELAGRAVDLGMDGFEGLHALQGMRYAATVALPEHVERIRREVIPRLPETPGVYRLIDARGRILYVGKATSLRDRVGSYFVGLPAKDVRLRDLARRTRSVSVDETSTEIEARVLEARTILDLKPPFNRAQREPGRRAWLRLEDGEGRRALSVHAWRRRDGAEWVGPLSGTAEARGLAEALGAVSGIAVERPRPRSTWSRVEAERTARAAGRVARAVPGGLPADGPALQVMAGRALGPVRQAMLEASADLAFEEARILRDWLELLERLESEGSAAECLAGDVAALALGDRAEVLVVRNGRMLGSVSWPRDEVDATTGVQNRLARLLRSDAEAGPLEAGGPLARRVRNDETWMLAQWVARSAGRLLERDAGETGSEFAQRILAACEEDPVPAAYSPVSTQA